MAITLQDYSTLREIQSLDVYIKTHLDKISSEQQRTEQIRQMRQKRSDQKDQTLNSLNELRDIIAKKEKELFQEETNLEQARTNLSSAASASQMQALEKQIDKGALEVDEFENHILELISQSEELELSIREDDEFLEGSKETLHEIESEISIIVKQEEEKIEGYDLRIDNLLSLVPDNLKSAFSQARLKNRFNNPITKIKANSCMMCRFIFDTQTSSQVELFKTVEFCGQCERLVAPLEA